MPTVSYRVQDPTGVAAVGSLDLYVNFVNHPPVAKDSSQSVNEDTPLTFALTASDPDVGSTDPTVTDSLDAFTIAGLPDPSAGVLLVPELIAGAPTGNYLPVVAGQVISAVQSQSLKFEPAKDFVGVATVEFKVTDAYGADSNVAKVTITVKNVNLSLIHI